MTEPEQPVGWVPEPARAAPAPSAPAPQDDGAASGAADRPEVPVAAAFAGGFLFALLLRRAGRSR